MVEATQSYRERMKAQRAEARSKRLAAEAAWRRRVDWGKAYETGCRRLQAFASAPYSLVLLPICPCRLKTRYYPCPASSRLAAVIVRWDGLAGNCTLVKVSELFIALGGRSCSHVEIG
jgi:hypothetical protein